MESTERPILEVVEGRLVARWPSERPGAGMTVDYSAMRFADGRGSVRGMPLVRACGRERARDGVNLLDATAGLGYDTYLLAMAGFVVTAVERSAEVFRLLEDAVGRADAECRDRITLRCGDARTIIGELRPEIVYMDPMYPLKARTSALPPKEMQMVRAMAGDDLDCAELFDVAMSVARRVVVKRPLHAKPMATPHHSIAGKLARFDVFDLEAPA
ncbi:MAG: class I SAM-dependent methyltransferase [Phycisphaerae bacterium]|nr:class I SAM-dependent methyltransferase [Phycisphaerae bacterium]